jgi:uncharacterized membrane protein
MQALVETLKAWQPHPFVDHFTVALIVIGVLFDLAGSLIESRPWLRLSALTLIILGTAAAWGSKLSGGWEAERVWENVHGPALDVLKRHAFLGDWLPWVFLVLAVWRLGVQLVGFLEGTRPIYLLVALIAAGVILYQGHLGGTLVYEYGVGTKLLPTGSTSESSQPSPTPSPAEASPLPTVFNPVTTPTPEVMPSPEASTPGASPTATPMESPSPDAASSPVATPSPSDGMPVNPPGAEGSPDASPSESPAPKNL